MHTLIYVLLLTFVWVSDTHAHDSGKGLEDNLWGLFLIALSGIIGYIVGAVKAFREEKQKAYGEIIPPILKMTYNPQDAHDEKEYCKALSKLWLYGSKKVTQKMEHALEIMHHPSSGNVTRALQEAVVEMRKDIQISPWQNIKPEDVNHLYTRIAGIDTTNDKDKAQQKNRPDQE
jgi:hypothetical protein